METTEKYFRNLKVGEEFLWCGTLYKKTDVMRDDFGFEDNAICVSSKKPAYFSGIDIVEVL